jgi:hypothetical protein
MSPFKQPPHIEELSELSWKRIENGVMSSIDTLDLGMADADAMGSRPLASNRRWLAAGALAACAAAAVIFFAVRDDTSPSPHKDQRSRIATLDSPSEVVVGDASIDVAPHTALWIEQHDEAVDVILEEGSVHLNVAPRKQRKPVSVHSGSVRVEVIGTEFGVSREGDDTQVVVYRGVVSVISDGERAKVAAGESWSSEPELAFDEDIIHTRKKHHSRRRKVSTRQRQTAPAPSDDEPGIGDRELYEQAAGLEASSPEAAIAIYRQLSASRGPWASNALFAHARLEHERGHRDDARKLLQRYLGRYPRGANAADARDLLDQLP